MRVKCEINFIPLVHSEDDDTPTQLLECQQSLKTTSFASCGVKEHFSVPCSDNSAHCLSRTNSPKPPGICTYEMCDYGVLVSGGWDPFTSRPSYRNNLRNVWKLLHSEMRYKRENIITFFGQGQKDEREYIEKICLSFGLKFTLRASRLFGRRAPLYLNATNLFCSRQKCFIKAI